MDYQNNAHPAANATALVERNVMQGTELAHITDQTNVLAQQAVAAIQARYVLAVNRPRNLDMVRQNILRECQRPSFAAVAIYNKPVGKGVTGPSIRFAEMAIRCMGNLFVETMLVSDTPKNRVVRVTVSDLETNSSYFKDINLEKTVERSSLRQGQTPLKTRHNSQGRIVYIVEATEDDMLSKEASNVSKAIRTCSLRLVPGDILEEALDMAARVMNDEAAKDPDAARKNMVDKFSTLGVTAEHLAKYLNANDLSAITPAQITHLSGVYHTIKDGEATWNDIYAVSPYREADTGDGKSTERDAKAAALQKQVDEKIAARKKKTAPPAETPQASEPATSTESQTTVDATTLCSPALKLKIKALAIEVYATDSNKFLATVTKGQDISALPQAEAEMIFDQLEVEAEALKQANADQPATPAVDVLCSQDLKDSIVKTLTQLHGPELAASMLVRDFSNRNLLCVPYVEAERYYDVAQKELKEVEAMIPAETKATEPTTGVIFDGE